MKGKSIREILGLNIRFYRNLRGWSQTELAEKANISTNYLSDIETCKKWPFPEVLHDIAQGLNVEIYELFKPEKTVEHSAGDTLVQYSEDAILLARKSYAALEHSLESLLKKYTE